MEKYADVVVLGGGGSGMVAAVRAAQYSGKKVIIVEKSPNTGGGMIMASTMRTFRSKWQKERHLKDVTEQYLRTVMDKTYWRLNPKLVENAVLATGQFFDWFCELAGEEVGEKFHVGRYVFDSEDGPEGPQMGGPGGVTGGGRLFMDTLREKCSVFDIEVLTKYRVVDAESEDGKLTAIIAQGPDGEVRINCKQCVLATGSWINNEEIVKEISPEFLEARKYMGVSPHTNPNYTGDGFIVASKVDAMLDKKNYTLRLMGPMVFSKSGVMANMVNTPYTLAINTIGKRYICEPSQIRNGVFDSGLVMMEQPKGYAFILFDSNNLEAAIEDHVKEGDKEIPGIFGLPPMPKDMESARTDIDNVFGKEKTVYKADTIEDLARQMEIEPIILQETIERYNQYCEEGFDHDCFKRREFLIPCNKAPYYAVKSQLGTDGAFGGVLVNEKMQAYKSDGTVIDNLYVTGDFASGRFLNMGGVKVQVLNDMSWALASGYIAGNEIGKKLK